ncbi:MAG: hypothetical protein P8R43_07345 [Planctomycetota bacterium]|nr:hypothetical protein [Planctomycetota bacterium]
MSTEKRPKIASFAVAASAILCLFIYSLDEPKPLPPAEPETLSSVGPMPMGGRIEIDHRGSGLVRVEPREIQVERAGAPVELTFPTGQPDAIDVAAAQASEARAAQTLRIIAMAQNQFKEARSIDINGDHVGEYGFLAELMGTAALRSGGNSPMDISELNAFLPRNFAEIVSTSEGGACEVGGYLFAVYLPATPIFSGEVEGLGEALHGGSGEAIPDPNQSALRWCAYAWPSTETFPARRAFFLDASGFSLSTLNAADSANRYIGAAHAPRWSAAYVRPDMSGKVGGEETCDENAWDR